jgi:hypothetical protein
MKFRRWASMISACVPALAGTLLLLFAIGNAAGLERLQAFAPADASQMVQFDVYLPLLKASLPPSMA